MSFVEFDKPSFLRWDDGFLFFRILESVRGKEVQIQVVIIPSEQEKKRGKEVMLMREKLSKLWRRVNGFGEGDERFGVGFSVWILRSG